MVVGSTDAASRRRNCFPAADSVAADEETRSVVVVVVASLDVAPRSSSSKGPRVKPK